MSNIMVRSRAQDYEISFGSFGAASVDDAFFIFDSNISEQVNISSRKQISLVASEALKRLSTIDEVASTMREAGVVREDKLVAVGGGVIQDVATLIASLYMRGIDWEYFPTTLTGMIDSCIGGKSSINAGSFKNTLGNIYPPKSIVIDTKFIETLSHTDLLSGLSEGVKICFTRGDDAFQIFLGNPASKTPANDQNTQNLIRLSLESKKWFVEIDEFDKGQRRLLNFGHTFGHAFETASGFRVPHGLAVALGMLAATSSQFVRPNPRIIQLRDYCKWLVLQWEGRFHALEAIDWVKFEEAILSDKKNETNFINLILVSDDGELTLKSFEKSSKTMNLILGVSREIITEMQT